MRTLLLVLAVAGLVMPLAALADEPKKETIVKEIDLKDAKLGRPMGAVDKPTVITSEDELKKAFSEEALQARLKKEVDFKTQKLVFFAWAGSGQDKLDFKVEKGEKAPEVVFQYKAGLTRDLRPHHHLYVIPKDVTWKVAK